ncbi:MAG: hypothetical protein M1812_001719 [Candelaria pacifica]|nr:MAG: hypothetical protein M1812_001719 [Candelaria pacifica]
MDGVYKHTKANPHVRIDLEDLPVEIILEIIFRLPFSAKGFRDLLLVNKRLHSIVRTYERSLSNTIATSQYTLEASLFPPNAVTHNHNTVTKTRPSFSYLKTLSCRHDILSTIIAKTADLNIDTTYHLRECLPQWQRLQKCGLLLLYLLHDHPTHALKSVFLASLPLPSLALLNLSTLFGTRVASTLGTGIIHSSFAANDAETRSDINLVFAELMLRHGPAFLCNILNKEEKETREVSCEWERLDEYQIHEVGKTRQRTLSSLLREAFARRCGCQGQEVGSRLWKEVQRPELWKMKDYEVADVVGRREEALVGLGA